MPCPKCHEPKFSNDTTGLCPKCQAEWDHIEAIFYARFLRGEYIIGTVAPVQESPERSKAEATEEALRRIQTWATLTAEAGVSYNDMKQILEQIAEKAEWTLKRLKGE